MMVSVGVLGDVMLGRGVAQRLTESAGLAVWGEALLALTASLELVIANLECCLAIGGRPTRRIPHKPFFFRGPRSATAQLRQLNVRAVGLANNQALDYEESALGETLAVLDHAGIAVAGTGRGSAARCPAVVAVGGARVAWSRSQTIPPSTRPAMGISGSPIATCVASCPRGWPRRWRTCAPAATR